MSRADGKRGRHPGISVVIPVYNVAPYLEKCLDSVLAQTYPNVEVIVIDDGSDDGSGDICSRYAVRSGQLRAVFFPQNRGPSAARNEGIRQARGEYITFVDADDYIEADMLERLYQNLSENGAEVSVCGVEGLRQEEGPAGVWSGAEAVRCLSLEKPFRHLMVGKLCAAGLVKRNPLDETVFYSEDLLFYYRLFSRAERVSYLPEKLYHAVTREGSQSRGRLSEKKCTSFRVNELVCRDAARHFPEALPGFRCIVLKADMWLAALAVGQGVEDGSVFGYLKRLQRDIRRHFTWEALSLCPRKKAAAVLTLYVSAAAFWAAGRVYWRLRKKKGGTEHERRGPADQRYRAGT